MIEIKLDAIDIENLFGLLGQIDAEIGNLHHSLRDLRFKKNKALKDGDYEKAAQTRQEELNIIRKMQALLKKKGLFKKKRLEIVIVES